MVGYAPLGHFKNFYKIGKKIFKKKYNNIVPYKVDKYLRFIRYIVNFSSL